MVVFRQSEREEEKMSDNKAVSSNPICELSPCPELELQLDGERTNTSTYVP